MKVFIYALVDPQTNLVRYVGKTVAPLRRLGVHLCDKSDTHRARWIGSLKSIGLKPVLEILECIDDPDNNLWPNREIYWIQWMKIEGFSLTNSHDGGHGGVMPTGSTRDRLMASFTPERRAAIAARNAARVWTPESRAKRGAVPVTEEHRAKLRAAFTPERLTAMSISSKNRKHSPESVEARASKIRGSKWTPERRAKIQSVWTQEKRDSVKRHHVGRKNTPETLAKMRESALRREAKKKLISPN